MVCTVCPSCGRETDALVGGLCPDCFRANHPLVVQRKEIKIEECRICGALRLGGSKWLRNLGRFEEEVLRRISTFADVRGEVQELSLNLERGVLRLKVLGKADEELPESYVEVHELRFRISRTICESCFGYVSKRKSAIVQIRARGRELTQEERKIIKNALSALSSHSTSRGLEYVPVEVKEEAFGMDIYFSSSTAANEFVRVLSGRLHFDVLETSKLIGVTNSGKEKHRLTIRLLLPPFKRGDLVDIGGKLFLVDSIASGKIIVRDLVTFERNSLPLSRLNLNTLRVQASSEDLEEGFVISNDGTSIYVMTASNREVLEIPVRNDRQAALLAPGSRVGILRRAGETIVVPRVLSD